MLCNQFFCFDVFKIIKINKATEIKTIEINKLKSLTCNLLIPHAKITAVVIKIINQCKGFPRNILFMTQFSF
jgi:hypothetical protein